MPTPSNAYADKIFSEHPLVLWALDEEIPDVIATPIPSNNIKSNIRGVGSFVATTDTMAKSYSGGSTDAGYYIYPIDGSGNVSKIVDSAGIPMVFGGANLSELYAHPAGGPSIIVPGKGFLNKDGQYRNYTVEFWLKAYNGYSASGNPTPFKFFGPVASPDGLYVDTHYIILKIGSHFVSHFIGEWNRPMLIQIQVSKDGAILLINGDIVGQIVYDVSTLIFPDKNDNLENDWLGFYASPYFRPNIDCISISPFLVPNVVAKKRFAYGQAVEIPQSIISKNGGGSLNVDYSVADYVGNHNYPTPNAWKTGVYGNLQPKGTILGLPDYELPDFYFYNSEGRITNLPISNYGYIDMSDSTRSFIKFESLPIGNNACKYFYVKFSILGLGNDTPQTVLKILDKLSGEYFELLITKQGLGASTARISGKISTMTDPIFINNSVNIIPESEQITIGFNIDLLLQNIGRTFLNGNQSNFIVYVGGEEATPSENKLFGHIYSVGFISETEMQLNNSISYDTVGFSYTPAEVLKPTYELIFKTLANINYADIKVSGFWQDQIPFTKLAKNVNGTPTFNFLQINNGIDRIWIDGPTSDKIVPIGTVKMYASTKIGDSSNNSCWWTAFDAKLMNKSMTFYPEDGISNSLEVADGVLIYPDVEPGSTMFNESYLSIGIEVNIPGIFTNPFVLKTLQIAAQSTETNKVIGSRYDINLIPEQSSGINPYSIYKGSSPHNYLTNNTGIRLLGTDTINTSGNRKIKLNFNKNNDVYHVGALQFVYNFNEINKILNSDTAILEIKNQTTGIDHLKIYLHKIADLATDSDIQYSLVTKLVNSDNTETTITLGGQNPLLTYYIDGHSTTSPTIQSGEWATIGILFPTTLNFNLTDPNHGIFITGPGLFNNFVYFYVPISKYSQQNVYEKWQDLKNSKTWAQVEGSPSYSWFSATVISQNEIVTITPDQIFNLYAGLNKIIVDVDRTNQVANPDLTLNGQQFLIYKNASWSSQVIKPV